MEICPISIPVGAGINSAIKCRDGVSNPHYYRRILWLHLVELMIFEFSLNLIACRMIDL